MSDSQRIIEARLAWIRERLEKRGLWGPGPPTYQCGNHPLVYCFWTREAYQSHMKYSCTRECGICGQLIPGGENAFNRHAWECSRARPRGTTTTGPR